MITADEVAAAYQGIKHLIHRTPVFRSRYFDSLTGRQIYFKAENLQKTGSFKARGALHAVRKLKSENPQLTGVITHSSGNHGQALAYAAQMMGVDCTVVVPRDAPQVKIDAIKGYGADVLLCEPTTQARVAACQQAVIDTGKVLVHPHNDINVMTGQGTIALELLEEIPDLDAILVPVGGGGMVSGIAVWAKANRPQLKVFCVEPAGKNIEGSIAAGKPVMAQPFDTLADGMRVTILGSLCFDILSQLCEKEVFSVSNAEITSAMRAVYERLKLVIEPSSATGVAAVLSEKFRSVDPSVKKVGVILCGGNVDLQHLPWL